MNPYDVLDVAKDADAGAIKKAYRKAANAHHPDKGGDADKFNEIQTAYDVLSDAGRRAKYDETGVIDGSVVDNTAAEALNVLANAFQAVMQGVAQSPQKASTMDLLGKIRGQIDRANADRAQMRAAIEIGIKNHEDLYPRFTSKSINLFGDMLKRQCDALKAQLAVLQTADRAAELALAMLKDMSFKREEMQAEPYQTFTFSNREGDSPFFAQAFKQNRWGP